MQAIQVMCLLFMLLLFEANECYFPPQMNDLDISSCIISGIVIPRYTILSGRPIDKWLS
jgi:hypothetical protein